LSAYNNTTMVARDKGPKGNLRTHQKTKGQLHNLATHYW
jgi:hypothetical protein